MFEQEPSLEMLEAIRERQEYDREQRRMNYLIARHIAKLARRRFREYRPYRMDVPSRHARYRTRNSV